ncbi:unnamed protein product [Ostreobium quekettii]|uniref:Uncharacterized protein n=1 Tax=Ostreobium quekettii TaxID=121088 RepID=A0A8S1IVH6_9CHLO|nr:unnamed protein product [Ostreobium quekettii]
MTAAPSGHGAVREEGAQSRGSTARASGKVLRGDPGRAGLIVGGAAKSSESIAAHGTDGGREDGPVGRRRGQPRGIDAAVPAHRGRLGRQGEEERAPGGG